jgi:hypothetical protein
LGTGGCNCCPNHSILRPNAARLLLLPDVVVIDIAWPLRSTGVARTDTEAQCLHEDREQHAATARYPCLSTTPVLAVLSGHPIPRSATMPPDQPRSHLGPGAPMLTGL